MILADIFPQSVDDVKSAKWTPGGSMMVKGGDLAGLSMCIVGAFLGDEVHPGSFYPYPRKAHEYAREKLGRSLTREEMKTITDNIKEWDKAIDTFGRTNVERRKEQVARECGA